MLNNLQIRLIQTAVRVAGLRRKHSDGRYRLLLAQYKQPNGRPVRSCKQLNNSQLEDMLAICEAHGWRCPGKPEDYFRQKVAISQMAGNVASFAQQSAIKHLAGDLGWNEYQLNGMIKRITAAEATNITALTPAQAYKLIEALKAILGRETGKQYSNLSDVKKDMETARDGKEQESKVG